MNDIEREREECAKIADTWLIMFSERQPENISAQKWACDAVRDIAEAIRNRRLND